MFCGFCGATIPENSVFCSDCGQQLTPKTDVSPQVVSIPPPTAAPLPVAASAVVPTGTETIVLRAGEQIWHFAEDEGHIEPGQRRPVLIHDEHIVHLAHTDRHLTAEELLGRVRSILAAQQVPVDVRLVKVKWIKDSREVRSRLVASLQNHPFSDIKMILGVDYMGNWASIQLHLGSEPDPIPPEAPLPEWSFPLDAGIALGGGVLLILLGLGTSMSHEMLGFPLGLEMLGFPLAMLGFLGVAYGGIRAYLSYKSHMAKVAAEEARRTAERVQRELKRAQERFSRTFKVDDMRLFCSAMRQVFQAVVDDIVSRGAEVVRVEGGRGGYFEAPQPTPRRSDAAAAGV